MHGTVCRVKRYIIAEQRQPGYQAKADFEGQLLMAGNGVPSMCCKSEALNQLLSETTPALTLCEQHQMVTMSYRALARQAHLDISCRGRNALYQQGLEHRRSSPHGGDAHCCWLGLHIAHHIPGNEPNLVGDLIAQILIHQAGVVCDSLQQRMPGWQQRVSMLWDLALKVEQLTASP